MIEVLAGEPAAVPIAANASFRDPSGRLFSHRGRVLRMVNQRGIEDLAAFLATGTARRLIRAGKLVGTRLLDADETREFRGALPGGAVVAEHEAIPFPSYPVEWPAEMLAAAGGLTLELAESLAGEGFGLKDATPSNVLFRGPKPVFVDLLSFERRAPQDGTWLAEAQFVRTFLLPLAAWRRFGVEPGRWLAGRRDGLEPEQVYRWLGVWERLGTPWLTLATLPTWLGAVQRQGCGGIYEPAPEGSAEKAAFVLERLRRRLRRALEKVAPPRPAPSRWTGYMEDRTHYPEADLRAKEEFVASCLAQTRPGWVLDAGANTGHFSRMAAAGGASVVAIDADAAATGACWRAAVERDLDILPLVVDLARPTPAAGWRNRESRSFLERAAGRFDLVLMLALAHHLLVTERVPLEQILDLGFDLTQRFLVLEYVGPSDAMFRRLARGRDALHADLTPQSFERSCRRRFRVVRRLGLENGRILYLLQKAG
jgi:SAM-dependent methyltransferase